jgi:Tol biopolymer transport system component
MTDMDSKLRDRLEDLAREVPPGPSMPPGLATRARRRVVVNVLSVAIVGVVVVVSAGAGIRALLRTEERGPFHRPRPTVPDSSDPEARTDRWGHDIAGWITYVGEDGFALVVDPDTSETKTLFPHESGTVPIAWSHDGSHLLLWRRGALIVQADTGEQVPLMTRASDVWGGSWSPDDTRVVFSEVGRPQNKPVSSIAITNVDGEGPSTSLKTEHDNGPALVFPAWSPNGKEIAFLFLDRRVGGVLMIMDADGSDARPLLGDNRRVGVAAPVWSPDGATLAFAGVQGSRGGIYTVNRDNGVLTRITDIEGAVSPAWSPDGTKIVFRVMPDDELFVMNRDGSGVRTLGVFVDRYSPILWYPEAD